MDTKALEHLSEVADARLDLAEFFRLAVAGLSALLVSVSWQWLSDVVALLPVHFTITSPYRSKPTRAEDSFHSATKTGECFLAFQVQDG